MNLGTMLQQSGAIDSIAKELGVDPQTAGTAAAVLLPAIVAGMGRDSSGSGGLGGLIGSLGGSAGGSLLDLVLGPQQTPVQQGNDILGQIFGNKDVSRSVADEAAGASGLDSTLLRKMLPLLAMAVAGYLAQRGQNQSPAQGAGTAPGTGGMLGGILGAIVEGFARR